MLESKSPTDKQKACIILNGNFLYLSCLSATFALQHGGLVPNERLAAKGLLDILGSKTFSQERHFIFAPQNFRDTLFLWHQIFVILILKITKFI